MKVCLSRTSASQWRDSVSQALRNDISRNEIEDGGEIL